MYSLYGAIPGMPVFPGMRAGLPELDGGMMGAAPMPMANAAPPPVQGPGQRGMSVPSAPPPAMVGQPPQQQQDPMQQMAMMAMMKNGGQQGVPGSQLSNILGISGSDVRSFLGLGNEKDKLLDPNAALPDMMKSRGFLGMGALTTGDMKAPMGVPEMPGMANVSSSLGAAPTPAQMPPGGIPPLDPGIGVPAPMPPPAAPWWQGLNIFGF